MTKSNKIKDNAIIKRVDENNLYRLLDRVVQNLKERYHLKAADINESALDVRHEYKNSKWRSPGGINYNDICKCCGYMQRYATCHAGLTRHAVLWFLSKVPANVRQLLFEKDSLNVVAAGGGPGNDLLGFCCAIEGIKRNFTRLNLTVIDYKSGWEMVFNEVMSAAQSLEFGKVGELLEDENIEINASFILADLVSEDVHKLQEADLILMVKVLSNVSRESQKRKLLKNVFSAMKEDAVFLCIDGYASNVLSCAKNKMKVLCTKNYHEFYISLDKNVSWNVMRKCGYEICALIKLNQHALSKAKSDDDETGENNSETCEADSETYEADSEDEDNSERVETNSDVTKDSL